MSVEAEPGSEIVTARTRAFEEIDAQVFAGPGRGATRSEAAASDRWGGPSPTTVAAYRRMFELVVKAPACPRRLQATDHATSAGQHGFGASTTKIRSSAPSSQTATEEDRRA